MLPPRQAFARLTSFADSNGTITGVPVHTANDDGSDIIVGSRAFGPDIKGSVKLGTREVLTPARVSLYSGMNRLTRLGNVFTPLNLLSPRHTNPVSRGSRRVDVRASTASERRSAGVRIRGLALRECGSRRATANRPRRKSAGSLASSQAQRSAEPRRSVGVRWVVWCVLEKESFWDGDKRDNWN